jgi:hypothetical protein
VENSIVLRVRSSGLGNLCDAYNSHAVSVMLGNISQFRRPQAVLRVNSNGGASNALPRLYLLFG